MKIYIILQADYCEWSTEYGFSKPVDIKFRKAHAEDAVSARNEANPSDQFFYEEMDFSLRVIPSISSDQFKVLNDVDVYNQGEQLAELVIMERVREIQELKEEVKKLKSSVASETARANRAESVRAKTEQELRTVRNTIRAAKKIDKPKFLGFKDSKGLMYHTDPDRKNSVFFDYLGSRFYKTIGEVRKVAGELTPIYEDKSE